MINVSTGDQLAGACNPGWRHLYFFLVFTMELPKRSSFNGPEDDLQLERFRAFVAATSDAVYHMSADWQNLHQLMGKAFLSDTDTTTSSWIEHYIPPSDRKRVQTFIDAAIQTRQPFESEHRVIRADGSIGWAVSRAIPKLNAQGEVIEWFGTASDITQRRLAEDARLQSEMQYQILFNSIDEGFCIIEVLFDAAGKPYNWLFCEVNPAFEKNNGLVNATGKTILELTPDIEPKWFDIYGKVAVTGEPLRFEEHSEALGRWFSLYAFRIGKPHEARVAVLFTDITQQKFSQEMLRTMEQRKAFLLEMSDRIRQLTDPIAIQYEAARLLGEYLGANRVGYAQTQDDDELVAVTQHYTHEVPDIQGTYRYKDYGTQLLKDMQQGKTVVRPDIAGDHNLSPAVKKAHAVLQLGATVNMPLLKQGRLVAILFVHFREAHAWTNEELRMIEETGERIWSAVERGKADAALQEASRRKDEFLAMLAHELRNPMSVLRSGLQLLNAAGDLDESSTRTVGMMSRQMEHLVRMVDDLLDVSRITQGKIELDMHHVELGTVVGSAVEAMQEQFHTRGKTLLFSAVATPLYVHGDSTRLAQVVSNLLTNGLRYTRGQGQVSVNLEADNGRALLRITDDGIGLTPDQLSSIFDLFVQGDNSLARAEGGLGIGLTIVQRLVKMHGGTVEVRSEGLGRGSEFTVTLPLVAAPAESETAGPVPVSGHYQAKRILVIDDNVDAAAVLTAFLNIKGFQVVARHSGESGIAAGEQHHPAVIICDIGMPGMDGYQTAQRIRQTTWGKSAVLIALTGYGRKEDKILAKEAGFDYHFLKPVNLDELAWFLEDLLHNS